MAKIRMYIFYTLPMFFSALCLGNPTAIHIEWSYKNTKDLKMLLYDIDGNQRLWDTKNVTSLNDTGIKDLIKNNTLMLEPNRKKRFALVTYNPTMKPIYFFAAPHATTPEEFSLGLRFKCLCVNHAFKVEPKNYWIRIVELRLDPSFNAEKLNIKHTLIAIAKEKAENHSKQDHE